VLVNFAQAEPAPTASAETAVEGVNADNPLSYLVTLPFRILWIVLVSVLLIVLANLLIGRVVRKLTAKVESSAAEDPTDTLNPLAVLRSNARRTQRIAAVGSLLKSVLAAIIAMTAVLTILPLLGIDIGPLLVSASVLGVALGFGAQNLIKDYLAGVFIVLEDQYGLGDVVEASGVIGTVEDVGLRVTQVRDLSGVVWFLRNGEILKVGNRSKGWTLATVDIPVDPQANLDAVRTAVTQVAAEMMADVELAAALLEAPYYAGVESVSSQGTVVRVAAKAAPDKQTVISRQLRERMRSGLQEQGIAIAAQPFVPPPTAR